jgi:preprotein translocase subunit YajC
MGARFRIGEVVATPSGVRGNVTAVTDLKTMIVSMDETEAEIFVMAVKTRYGDRWKEWQNVLVEEGTRKLRWYESMELTIVESRD